MYSLQCGTLLRKKQQKTKLKKQNMQKKRASLHANLGVTDFFLRGGSQTWLSSF